MRQRDFNGTTTSEGIIYIVRPPESGVVSSVYPVPSTGNVSFEYNTKYETTITVDVTTPTGVIVSSQDVAVVPGMNVIGIDLTGEAPGVYAIQVRDRMSGATSTKRVVIAKE